MTRLLVQLTACCRPMLLGALSLCFCLAIGCSDDGGDADDNTASSSSSSGGNQTSSGSTGSSSGGASSGMCTADSEHSGEGTYYAADGSGNCSFPASPNDLMVAAMNETDYATSAVCGECVSITGPNGSVTVRIVDRCPECQPGDIDLSAEAFAVIAEPSAGRVAITWRQTACAVDGPVQYHFKEGSNQWWSAVQVRNHRHPIASFEWLDDEGNYRAVERLNYNFFVDEGGMGPGPYTFRITDIHGHSLIDEGIEFVEGGVVDGQGQFPECEDAP